MSIDVLQEKIRKKKNALMVDFSLRPSMLPPELVNGQNPIEAYLSFCRELLTAMKSSVAAVRFRFSVFALMGPEGLNACRRILEEAEGLGYYVLLDGPELTSSEMAQFTADVLLGPESLYPCDGLVLPFYAGSDVLKPFLPYCAEGKKDLFAVIRTSNKSAPELQDLLTGSRLVHLAAADRVSRYSTDYMGKYGYSRVGVLAAATSADSIRNLRGKYPGLFLLVDGLDYPGANLKNVSLAFDRLGRGAVYCAASMVTCAWTRKGSDGSDYVQAALDEVERLRKGLGRYIPAHL